MIFKLPLRCRINQEEYVLILNSVCYVRGDVLNFCGCFLSDQQREDNNHHHL